VTRLLAEKIFRFAKFAILFVVLSTCAGTMLPAQSQNEAPREEQAPLITLDEAVSLAVESNRLVKNSSLEAEKFDFRVNTAYSRRLPQFQFSILGGELLQPVYFKFPAGAFGTFPATGPIPSTETSIKSPAVFTSYLNAGITQPLSQQYKINLGIQATKIGRDIAREDVRAQRQKIANEVRTAYFDIVATQVAVEAERVAVQTLEEAQRVTKKYELEQAVLRGDVLEVDSRLDKARYELSVVEDGLATQHEHLNQLLSRALTTPFRVETRLEQTAPDTSLEAARAAALQNRPEVRQAQLKIRQAEYDRRIAKAEYIPDLSLAVQYLGTTNIQVLPQNVAVAGFLLTWEPFDWGRRRNNIAEKSKTIQQARNTSNETEAQVSLEVGMKYRKWQEASLLLKAARTGQESTTEQFRVVNNKYKEQAALIKDLLESQARNAEAGFKYQQALSAYWATLADLRHAMGEE
jgi:outer membrane protein